MGEPVIRALLFDIGNVLVRFDFGRAYRALAPLSGVEHTEELLARIEALLRRNASPAAPSSASYSFGDVKVDVRRTEVRKGGEEISLSAKEFQLLKYFLEHRGDTLSRDVLLHEVWDYDSTPTTRTVDVHIAWLRQKLEENAKQPRWILTVHGMGYKFAE